MKKFFTLCTAVLLFIAFTVFTTVFFINTDTRANKISILDRYRSEQIIDITNSHTVDIIFKHDSSADAVIVGGDIKSVDVINVGSEYNVSILLTTNGYSKLITFLSNIEIEDTLNIYLGEQLISSPVITDILPPNPVNITTVSHEAANILATSITNGSIPTKINQLDNEILSQLTSINNKYKTTPFLVLSIVFFVGAISAVVFTVVFSHRTRPVIAV